MGSVDRKLYSCNTVYLNGNLVSRFTHERPIVDAFSTDADFFLMFHMHGMTDWTFFLFPEYIYTCKFTHPYV